MAPFWGDNKTLEAEGQIIEGTTNSLQNLGCRINIKIGKLKFNNVRLELSIDDPNLSQVLNFEKIKGKIIRIEIE